MALPKKARSEAEEDLRHFCERRVAVLARDQVRLEYEFRGDAATLVERRVPWHPALQDAPWTRMPVAQFRYDRENGHWTLHWPDRNTRWHEDDGVEPSHTLKPLLAEVDEDPTGIYWG